MPNGHLVLGGASGSGEEAAGFSKPLRLAFSKSPGAGLIVLATDAAEEVLEPAAAYWREFAGEFLVRLCQAPPSQREGEWVDVACPDLNELQSWQRKAPPAAGMEYLSTERLADLWQEMNGYAAAEVAEHEGAVDDWLKKRHPLWRMVGRVTFHLAENKSSEEFPFAFLATYTHRLSKGARLQYLPLGRALKQSIESNDLRRLESLLAPVQRAAELSDLARELLDSRKVFQALAWTPAEAFRFLQAVPRLEAGGVIVKVPDWWSGGRPSKPQVGVTLDSKKKTTVGFDAMLGFDVNVCLDGENLTPEQLQALMDSTGNLVSIKGRWVEVDRERLSQALDHWRRAAAAVAEGGLSFAQGMRMLAGFTFGEASGISELDAAMSAEGGGDWSLITAGGKFRQLLDDLRNPDSMEGGPAVHLGKELKADLRPYQQAGVDWLWQLSQLGLGGCLADDMGLGKTLQVIALLLQMRNHDKQRAASPGLIVVPASLVGNWRAEIERFAPSLRVRYAHASQMPREQLGTLVGDVGEGGIDVVITTYGMLGRIDGLADISWRMVVLDEAQAIKNPRTAQSRKVREVAGDAQARFALTGTPIENSVGDLWAQFDFLNPGLLGTATRFREVSASLAASAGESEGYAKLRTLVSPYILRRLKTDRSVISDLPDKTEVRALCSLTKGQATLYQKTVQQLSEDLKEAEGIERNGLVLTYLMRLKQICNHPALWTGSGNFDAKDSGKLKRLREICQEIASRGEKVLVFSQFREMCGPLTEFLEADDLFGRAGLLLHGGTAVQRRQKLVEQFQRDDGPPFFVISLKAGGTGLNLTAASHVIHFDRWWNPAVENQATDRAFRIGQKNNVLVHKFVCSGTIEERIDRVISEKQELADEILGTSAGAEKMLTAMSNEELLDFVSMDLGAAVF